VPRPDAKVPPIRRAGRAARTLDAMSCPTCGCARHVVAKPWQVPCTVCGEERWPTALERPTAYVCVRCPAGTKVVAVRLWATPPETRAARLAAAQKTVQKRATGGGHPAADG
jgi:hypothetical protein